MNKTQTNNRDYWPTKQWRSASPSSCGMDSAYLEKLDLAIRARHKNINGAIIVKNGYIVFEKYFNAFGPADTHNVASVTKSFISALIGIAIDKGYIQGVEQRVLDFFPEYPTKAGDFAKRTVTIRQLLTMTAPIASKTVGNKWEPLDRLRRQPDWVKYTLDMLGKGTSGQFQYSTAGAHLLSAILTRATGLCAREFANKHLFMPMGISEIPDCDMKSFSLDDVFGKNVTGWIKDPQGVTVGGMGLTITPRDMTRFGFLYLNKGLWEEQQVISEQWISASTAMTPNEYGYLWWLREKNGLLSYSALGSGGNVICCIPEKDLVVVFASKIVVKPRDSWELIDEYIIPSVVTD